MLFRSREDVNDSVDKIILESIDLDKYDCIIFSDYCKGFLSIDDIKYITLNKKSNCITFIDTKKIFSNFIDHIDFIKINTDEFKNNTTYLKTCTKPYNLIVTEGDRGATLYTHNSQEYFSTTKVVLRDVCGAGDTFLAALAIQYLKTFNIHQSISFANYCASKVVSQFGVVTI